ncbi:unnamed protein product [Phytomonas sp. EM1]|nr:unnamed protein product [Phytomonas sp. EM1]|eukprot:CCW62226.1 unnamed protein product [Phytomonas sp. isolate EM1]
MACITGDETGLLKVWNIAKSSGATLSYSFGEQNRQRGIMGMCWVDSSTSSVAFSTQDGDVTMFNTKDGRKVTSANIGHVSALPNAMSFVKGKLIMVTSNASVLITNSELELPTLFEANGPVDAVHIQRKYGMIAIGGNENELCVYDLGADSAPSLVFKAQNVRDHILDVPYPTFITGTCIINPFVFCTSTAYHQVRFYDRRSSARPVQEFEINREIERRPTRMLQWNSNKFLIGEASGDVHLYDTRRGFTSRAKLRGGVGSVRSMAKHPAGHQLLGVAGLDRKARLYHVPTGKLLLSIYTKQRVNCILFDKQLPLSDNVSSYSRVVNSKQPERAATLGEDVWDDMDPVIDELDEGIPCAEAKSSRKRERNP